MKNLILFLLVLSPIFLFCQDEPYIQPKQAKIIKFDISGLMGDQQTNSSGIQIGLESGLKDNLSLEQDLMVIFKAGGNFSGLFTIPVENILGVKTVSELRYYLKNDIQPQFTDVYVAPNLIMQFTNADRLQMDENNKPNTYQVNRFVIAVHGKIGLQFAIHKNIMLDLSAGAGVRYISSHSIGEKLDFTEEYEYLYNKAYNSGSGWFPGLTGGFRIGYRF